MPKWTRSTRLGTNKCNAIDISMQSVTTLTHTEAHENIESRITITSTACVNYYSLSLRTSTNETKNSSIIHFEGKSGEGSAHKRAKLDGVQVVQL
jgi:hypothetical protein